MTRILLVEDHPTISESLRLLLQHEGHDVALCKDADSALVALQDSTHPDVALVDYWLGAGTAEPVLKALRHGCPNVRVVLITGGSRDVGVETTRWLGALDGIDGFLQKPFTRSDIRTLFQRLGL